MKSIGEVLAGMDPPLGMKPGRRLRARSWIVAAAHKALLRGCDQDWRLRYALEAFGVEILRTRPQLWRLEMQQAAVALAHGRPVLGWTEAELGKPGGLWQDAADPGGEVVRTLPVIDWGGPLSSEPARLVELLALDPEDPARWWRSSGAVSWLGSAPAVAPNPALGPLRLYEHPLDWARAGGEASGTACLLDPESPESGGARRILLGPRDLAVLGPAAAEYGRRLKRLQARLRPPLPKVLMVKGGAG